VYTLKLPNMSKIPIIEAMILRTVNLSIDIGVC
jgi:hypothetical protein